TTPQQQVTRKQSGGGFVKVLGIGCLSIICLFVLLILIGAIGRSCESGGSRSSGSASYSETRRAIREGIVPRTGPGLNFPLDNSGALFPEETIYVLGEQGGWIRFRVSPRDLGWSGWVEKDQ